jgi:hypothetical protein
MIVLQETTKWDSASAANHVYVLSDDKRSMIAYIKAGTKEVKKFSKPLPFYIKGRTFRKIK